MISRDGQRATARRRLLCRSDTDELHTSHCGTPPRGVSKPSTGSASRHAPARARGASQRAALPPAPPCTGSPGVGRGVGWGLGAALPLLCLRVLDDLLRRRALCGGSRRRALLASSAAATLPAALHLVRVRGKVRVTGEGEGEGSVALSVRVLRCRGSAGCFAPRGCCGTRARLASGSARRPSTPSTGEGEGEGEGEGGGGGGGEGEGELGGSARRPLDALTA